MRNNSDQCLPWDLPHSTSWTSRDPPGRAHRTTSLQVPGASSPPTTKQEPHLGWLMFATPGWPLTNSRREKDGPASGAPGRLCDPSGSRLSAPPPPEAISPDTAGIITSVNKCSSTYLHPPHARMTSKSINHDTRWRGNWLGGVDAWSTPEHLWCSWKGPYYASV